MRNSWVGPGCATRTFLRRSRRRCLGKLWLTQKMKLKSISRVFMQVIVATVSSRLLILGCFLFFFRFAKKTLVTGYGLLRTSRSHLGNERIDSREDLESEYTYVCVRGSCPSLSWCMRATLRGRDGDSGTPLIGTILYITGATASRTSNKYRRKGSPSKRRRIEIWIAVVTVFFIEIIADEPASISQMTWIFDESHSRKASRSFLILRNIYPKFCLKRLKILWQLNFFFNQNNSYVY